MTALSAIACATCQSQPGQTSTLASNGAVYVMLGCLAVVGLGILSVVISFVRRARRAGESAPDTTA